MSEDPEYADDREYIDALLAAHHEVIFRADGTPSRADYCAGCEPGDNFLPCEVRDVAGIARLALTAMDAAYTLLVSVQPCVARMVGQSPNAETLRLNRVLDAAIDAWVKDYLATRGDRT